MNIARFGWGEEHPKYPKKDWRYEVANEDTLLGYEDWVIASLEADDSCDECGAIYPSSAPGLQGDFHAESCSLFAK